MFIKCITYIIPPTYDIHRKNYPIFNKYYRKLNDQLYANLYKLECTYLHFSIYVSYNMILVYMYNVYYCNAQELELYNQ